MNRIDRLLSRLQPSERPAVVLIESQGLTGQCTFCSGRQITFQRDTWEELVEEANRVAGESGTVIADDIDREAARYAQWWMGKLYPGRDESWLKSG